MTPPIRNLERLSTKGGEATLIAVCGDVIVGFLDRSNRFATHVASILRYFEWSSVRYEVKRCAYKLRPLACPQLWPDFTVSMEYLILARINLFRASVSSISFKWIWEGTIDNWHDSQRQSRIHGLSISKPTPDDSAGATRL